MSCVKGMLKILMDGITDSEMALSYKDEAALRGDKQMEQWFHTHAKDRVQKLESDYEFVSKAIGLEEKVRSGDEIALALMEHIDSQIDRLMERI